MRRCLLCFTRCCLRITLLIGMSGLIYLIGACVLNAVFIYKAVKLKIAGNDEAAMDLFRFSIIHLMVLFVILFIDKWLPL